MTEEQIRDGYERLDSSLRAPQDAFDRVEKRMGARRRRRRIGVAAGTAVVVAAVGGYTAVSMGGSDDGRDGVVAVDPPPAPLVMTRPDGSTYEFTDLTISCDPPGAAGGGSGSGDQSHVYLSSPILIDGERVTQPFVLIEAAVDKLEQPRTFTLPIESADGSSEGLPLTVFIADTEGPPTATRSPAPPPAPARCGSPGPRATRPPSCSSSWTSPWRARRTRSTGRASSRWSWRASCADLGSGHQRQGGPLRAGAPDGRTASAARPTAGPGGAGQGGGRACGPAGVTAGGVRGVVVRGRGGCESGGRGLSSVPGLLGPGASDRLAAGVVAEVGVAERTGPDEHTWLGHLVPPPPRVFSRWCRLQSGARLSVAVGPPCSGWSWL